ncbi:hypothetical protein AGR3A_Lc140222 [Agrobacterium tomkonis CFBP 6623]|uniref:Uncharacterized protein n=1 Tax=Agrobacterium tomkonis CFBP 6623 TaxID=1183432 RepID=A0A1S7RQX8_9HYPH|nr:hypothetical protein AGR3A_Lc140222 [Agrobacterium tomkonis CFBP 6623]
MGHHETAVDVETGETEVRPVPISPLTCTTQAAILIGSDRNDPDICTRSRGGPVVPSGRGGSCRYVR